VKWVIKEKPQADDEPTRLKYIEGGLLRTPEILVLQAQKEVALFADRMQRMFGMVRMLFDEEKRDEAEKLFQRIEKYEDISDNMETEIAHYLEQVSDGHLSDETKGKIRSMLRTVGELESIGDSCYKLGRIMHRRLQQHTQLTPDQENGIRDMMKLTGESLMQMCLVMNGRREEYTMRDTLKIEDSINGLRDQLRLKVRNDDSANFDYVANTMFVEVVNECERLADYVVNIVEARLADTGLVVDETKKIVTIDGEQVMLTRTEFDLLQLLHSHPHEVFSRQQLIDRIWPSDVVVTDRTVDVNITRLRKKLGRFASCVVSRQGFGYCFEEWLHIDG